MLIPQIESWIRIKMTIMGNMGQLVKFEYVKEIKQ